MWYSVISVYMFWVQSNIQIQSALLYVKIGTDIYSTVESSRQQLDYSSCFSKGLKTWLQISWVWVIRRQKVSYSHSIGDILQPPSSSFFLNDPLPTTNTQHRFKEPTSYDYPVHRLGIVQYQEQSHFHYVVLADMDRPAGDNLAGQKCKIEHRMAPVENHKLAAPLQSHPVFAEEDQLTKPHSWFLMQEDNSLLPKPQWQ